MFPVEILARIVDIVLGRLVEQSTADKIAARRRRKFARDLFEFYEDLVTYIDICRGLAQVIDRPNFGQLGYDELRQNFEAANWSADRLAKVTGKLADKFFPVLGVGGPYADRWEPSKQALRRGAVMDVYDDQLAKLARAAYESDTNVITLVEQISKLYFNRFRKEIWVYIPDDAGITPLLPYLGHGYPTETGPYAKLKEEWDPPSPVTRASLSENNEFVDRLRRLIHHNIEVVEMLRRQTRESIRQHFSIDDLL